MDKEKKVARTRAIIKKVQKYNNLWTNPDFQAWRKDVVNGRLRRLKNRIVLADVSTQEGRDKVIAMIQNYQALQEETEGMFKIWEHTEKEAQKNLKKLKEEL